jgi:hypothetical protein
MASAPARPTVQNAISKETAAQHGFGPRTDDLLAVITTAARRKRHRAWPVPLKASRQFQKRQPEWIVPAASARAVIGGLVRSGVSSLEVHERSVLEPSSCVAGSTTRAPYRLECLLQARRAQAPAVKRALGPGADLPRSCSARVCQSLERFRSRGICISKETDREAFVYRRRPNAARRLRTQVA